MSTPKKSRRATTADHTPPPWRAWDRDGLEGGILITDESGKVGVARVIQRQERAEEETPQTRRRNKKLCAANAAVIVAAPKMLAALRGVMEWHRGTKELMPDELFELIRSAIAETHGSALARAATEGGGA